MLFYIQANIMFNVFARLRLWIILKICILIYACGNYYTTNIDLWWPWWRFYKGKFFKKFRTPTKNRKRDTSPFSNLVELAYIMLYKSTSYCRKQVRGYMNSCYYYYSFLFNYFLVGSGQIFKLNIKTISRLARTLKISE